jgi:hypothetical protein
VDADGLDAGIHAIGREGPGGIFEVKLDEAPVRAQLRIVPVSSHDDPPAKAFSPKVFEPTKVVQLPLKAKAGEFLVTRNPKNDHATLWFCVVQGGHPGDKSKNAIWREVLLGPDIKGQG